MKQYIYASRHSGEFINIEYALHYELRVILHNKFFSPIPYSMVIDIFNDMTEGFF